MKITEIIKESASAPTAKKVDGGERVTTGVRNTTVPAPGGKWVRITPNYNWAHQQANFDGINSALERNGYKLTQVASLTYKGTPAYTVYDRHKKTVMLTSFVAIAPGVLVWQKYEGATAGGGQNYIYVGGEKIKTTHFLALPPKKQDALITGTKAAADAAKEKARRPMPDSDVKLVPRLKKAFPKAKFTTDDKGRVRMLYQRRPNKKYSYGSVNSYYFEPTKDGKIKVGYEHKIDHNRDNFKTAGPGFNYKMGVFGTFGELFKAIRNEV